MKAGVRAALILAIALVPAAPAAAQSLPSSVTQPAIPTLKPGQFKWFDAPEMIKASTERTAPIKVIVAIQQQVAHVYRGDTLVGVTTVSTGAPGHDTPLGEFKILEKQEFHRSNLYSDAPMPFMQRLTWDGIALHAGELPGRPASHGCIRLPKAFAKQLFELTSTGGSVVIVDDVLDVPLYAEPAPGPVLTADTASLAAQGAGEISSPAPTLASDTRNLGGSAYDVLTMAGDPPAEAKGSWVAGPAKPGAPQ